jgi:chromosome segregation ATPase
MENAFEPGPEDARQLRAIFARNQKRPAPAMMNKHPVKQAHTRGEGLIQSNSIQQQFATLSNDRDKFRKEKEQAEQALVRAQHGYQVFKKDQDELTMKNLQAKAELGAYTKKLDMLKEEEKRIARSLENDTKAVESCTNHLKGLESKKEEKENKFVAQLNPVTLEIAIFLQKRLEKKVGERITVDTVSSVLLPFLQAKQKEGRPELQNGLYGLDESINKLKVATSKRDEAAEQLRKLFVDFQKLGVDLDSLMEDNGKGTKNDASSNIGDAEDA